MEQKKHIKADLEKKKGVYSSIGLLLALAIVLVAFEYRTLSTLYHNEQVSVFEIPDEVDIIPITRPKTPKKPNPEVLKQIISNILIDDAAVEDPIEIVSLEILPDEAQNISTQELFTEEIIIEESLPTIVDEMPEFKGGLKKMREYLQNNIKYPPIAIDANIQGKVYLSFIVEKDGSISNVEVESPINGGCSEEALRVVKNMPNWKPGKQMGKAVRVKFYLPIQFKLK